MPGPIDFRSLLKPRPSVEGRERNDVLDALSTSLRAFSKRNPFEMSPFYGARKSLPIDSGLRKEGKGLFELFGRDEFFYRIEQSPTAQGFSSLN